MGVETNISITRVERNSAFISELPIRLKHLVDLFVVSTIFTSIAAAAFLSFALMLFLNTIMVDMLLCTALITYSVYSLNRITDISEDTSNLPERIAYLHNKKMIILISSGLAYLIALIIGFLRDEYLLLIFLMPLFIGILYSVRLSSFRIKDVFAMKNLSVAFSFAFSASAVPFLFNQNIVIALLLFTLLFIKIFVNTVLFDIRDIEGDKKSGARTIPVIWGINKTKSILMVMNSLLFIWLIVCYVTEIFIIYLPVILFSIIYTYAYIWLFVVRKKPHNKYNYDFLIDGEYLILITLAICMYCLIG